MHTQKTILVTGATGALGGSVARFLLEEGFFKVKCLTRNTLSEKALALKDAGAELVKGDMNDITSLSHAMRGVDGVFGVTGFCEQEKDEYQQGKNLVFAVVVNRIDFFIYSSLPAMKKISKGNFDVPVFNVKNAIAEYARSLKPDTSFIHVADYYEHFISHLLPHKSSDGNYYVQFPQKDANYATVSANDIGGVVRSMFLHPSVYKKRTVGIVGTDMHASAYTEVLSKVLGKPVLYKHIPHEEFSALDFPGAVEMATKHAFYEQYIPERKIDLIESYGLHPEMQAFETWLLQNRSAFLEAMAEQEKIAG